jgi:hypothetical protein
MQIVYEFWFNPCIYEGTPGCVSLHHTRKGAEEAMKLHKEYKRKEFEELYKDEEDINWTYDSMYEWGIEERYVFN